MEVILVYLLGFAAVGSAVSRRALAGWLVAFLALAMAATLWWSA